MGAASQIAVRHFGKRTVAALKARGIEILSLTVIPAASGSMPFANGTTGYNVNDNGLRPGLDCGRSVRGREAIGRREMIVTKQRLGGGAIEIGIRNDARELLAVVTHPCKGAKWFLHGMGFSKPQRFKTEREAVEAARKTADRAR